MKEILKSARECAGELSPSCREAVRLQSQGMDARLPWRQRAGLRIHLFLCVWCRRYARQLRFLRLAAREQGNKSPGKNDARLPPEARERIKKSFNAGPK